MEDDDEERVDSHLMRLFRFRFQPFSLDDLKRKMTQEGAKEDRTGGGGQFI